MMARQIASFCMEPSMPAEDFTGFLLEQMPQGISS
jgi:hypothetical protein